MEKTENKIKLFEEIWESS